MITLQSCRSGLFWSNTLRIKVRNSRGFHVDAYKYKSVRIGCASGFWGDTPTAVPQLLHQGKLDFLVFDYLSEITMSLLAVAKNKNPMLGYAPDFVLYAMAPYLSELKKQGVKVVGNAGGLNPASCASALKAAAQKAGVKFNIATVTGDDLMAHGESVRKFKIVDESDASAFPENFSTVNAYLGAGPIAGALDEGADIVITGRCVDSALVLGPLLHTFQWKLDEWDKLSAGSLAGHLLECGAQSTGGTFTDWHLVPNWANNGFPIAEVQPNGEFVMSKPKGTGGHVSRGTVAEQLVYEVHDPANYGLPDVVCDFSNVQLKELEGGVAVTGAKGKPPTQNYKVSATYSDGFRSTVVCPVVGPQAAVKAKKTAEAILNRCEVIYKMIKLNSFSAKRVELLGAGANYGPHAKATEQETREAVMWLAVQHADSRALEIFGREIASAATGMAPGLTALVGGRPRPAPVLKLHSFFYPKDKVEISIVLNEGVSKPYKAPTVPTQVNVEPSSSPPGKPEPDLLKGSNMYTLSDLAYTRSGDKGNTANIGVIARDSSYLPYIKAHLTEDAVSKYFSYLSDARYPELQVKRFNLPGISAVNFVLHNALGGGGIASLRSDPQGKGLGQILLDFELKDMPDLEEVKAASR